MSENERHYYQDMQSFCKVIIVCMVIILTLCMGILLIKVLKTFELVTFGIGFNECLMCDITLYGMMVYSLFCLRFAKREQTKFEKILSNPA